MDAWQRALNSDTGRQVPIPKVTRSRRSRAPTKLFHRFEITPSRNWVVEMSFTAKPKPERPERVERESANKRSFCWAHHGVLVPPGVRLPVPVPVLPQTIAVQSLCSLRFLGFPPPACAGPGSGWRWIKGQHPNTPKQYAHSRLRLFVLESNGVRARPMRRRH